ncbi:hypothetical protein [Methyloceanibacter methanicus]|uniref:hypothetical protein n=1 Tax=Methyloceanibacter methanicus TaxID=1774968 RepID=UPI00114D07D2|nr:hypothetical protein [Methyloceanibacter methanicus]
MMYQPYGNTLFCDDIRQEVGGKFSLMGVFADHLVINSSPPTGDDPVVLSKIAVSSIIVVPHEYPSYSLGRLRVSLYGGEKSEPEVLFERELPKRDFETPPRGDISKFVANIVMSPVVFSSSNSSIKVRAYLDDIEIRLGVLRVSFSDTVPEAELTE